MQYIPLILVILILAWLVGRGIRHRSLYPFLPLRYNFGKRRDTFRRVLEFLDQRKARVLLETGTAREGLAGCKSNGASTAIFGLWASQNGATLHSVDISEESIKAAKTQISKMDLLSVVNFHQQDSIQFLNGFAESVDFLYLDSYDYDKLDRTIQVASQEHHLAEFKAIEPRLHDDSLVLIDDCRLPNGGKGKLVIEYMLRRGWSVLEESYQVFLIKRQSAI